MAVCHEILLQHEQALAYYEEVSVVTGSNEERERERERERECQSLTNDYDTSFAF
jgi:hypothetical protein